MSWESFQSAYKNAPSEVQTIIDSDVIPNSIEFLYPEDTLTVELFSYIVRLTSHYILKNISEEEYNHACSEVQANGSSILNTLTTLMRSNENTSPPNIRIEPSIQIDTTIPLKPLTREEVLAALGRKG